MALEGSLQDMSLVDLFQVFRMGPKSGMLILQHEDKRGVIYVHEGRLLDAFVVQGVARTVIATRDEAVLSLLAWHEACFVFRHDLSVVGRPTRIEHDAEWLVLESMRRSTRTPVASTYQNLTIETRLQLSPLPNSAESSVSLDVDQWRILSHAANNEDLQTICAATNIDKERTFRIVNELLAIGLVEIAPPSKRRAPRPAVAPPTMPMAASSEPSSVTPPQHFTQPLNDCAKVAPTSTAVGRSLLTAIMRRVSEL